MFILFIIACGQASLDSTNDSADGQQNELSFLLTSNSALSLELPDDWNSFMEAPFAPFTATDFYGNIAMDPIDPTHTLQSGEVVANVFAWNVADYACDWYVSGDMTAGLNAFAASEAQVADEVTDVQPFTLLSSPEQGLVGAYFVESVDSQPTQDGMTFPGATTVQLYVDMHGGNLLNLSATIGQATPDLTVNSATWPIELADYWQVVSTMAVRPSATAE